MVEPTADVRLTAVRLLTSVVRDGKSFGELLPAAQETLDTRNAALLQELTFGAARWSYQLDAQLRLLQKKPLRNKDSDVKMVLWLAMYEIEHMRTPDYAVVSSYAGLTKKLRKVWAKAMVNATLREFIRRRQDDGLPVPGTAARYSLPAWMVDEISRDWPAQAEQVFTDGNTRAPLVLRINRRAVDRDTYLPQLRAALDGTDTQVVAGELGRQSLVLDKSVRITGLPGFEAGWFSVQDSAAQLAAELLDPQSGEHVLDACAAPGGKTCHLLEIQQSLQLLAIDSSQARLQRVHQNLQRLNLTARCLCADASEVDHWWDKQAFDAILLDAPCSALGVLRRHPEIRLLRRESDLDALQRMQAKLLSALWRTLKPGGRLVYATCSVLKRENEQQIGQFLRHNDDATEQVIDADWGQPCEFGRQILPGQHGADGFYYAILTKTRHEVSA